ncbi:unnamed protein product [Caenorhabditis brenneri]
MNRYNEVLYNVPIGERWFEIKVQHNQGHRIIFVDSKDTVIEDQNFLGRLFNFSTTDKFMLGRKAGDPENAHIAEVEMVLTIKKRGNVFEYTVSIGGVPLKEHLAKNHRKSIVWELPIGFSKPRIFLHLESSNLWYKGREIGERQDGFRRDGPKRDLKINFAIEGRQGSIEVQNMNNFEFYVLKFDGKLVPKVDNWHQNVSDE